MTGCTEVFKSNKLIQWFRNRSRIYQEFAFIAETNSDEQIVKCVSIGKSFYRSQLIVITYLEDYVYHFIHL